MILLAVRRRRGGDRRSAPVFGSLTRLPNCQPDTSNCIPPEPVCVEMTDQEENNFLIENNLLNAFGTNSSCYNCHVNNPTDLARLAFTYSIADVNEFRITLLYNFEDGYPHSVSHYNDGTANYGRLLELENDVAGLSLLAHTSRVGTAPAQGYHTMQAEFINADGSPNAIGEALLTFIDMQIHPEDHEICTQ